MAKRDSEWLTLGQASDLLGIHPTTLRAWVANGQLHAFLTPGGHRRFQLGELRQFISSHGSPLAQARASDSPDKALQLVREKLDPALMQEQSWYRAMQESDRSFHKSTGRRLLGLLLLFADHNITSKDLLLQVREVGRAYGVRFRNYGLPVSEVARAFVMFRRMIVESIFTTMESSSRFESPKTDLEARLNLFMDELLVAILAGYENIPKVDSGITTPHHKRTSSYRSKGSQLTQV